MASNVFAPRSPADIYQDSLGVRPKADPKAKLEAASARHGVPVNVLLAIAEADGDTDLANVEANARDLGAVIAGGGDLNAAIEFKTGDAAKAKAIGARANQLLDMIQPEAAPAPEEDGGSVVGDLARQFGGTAVSGIGGGVEALGIAAEQGVGRTEKGEFRRFAERVGEGIRGAGDALTDSVSEAGKQALAGSTPTGDVLDPSSWSLGDDPSMRGYAMQIAGALGSMAPVVAASVLTRNPTVAAAAGAAQGGGAGAEEARQSVLEMAGQTDADGKPMLAGAPAYQKAIAEGLSHDDAVARTADEAARLAFNWTAPVSGLGGAATQRIIAPVERRVAGSVAGAIAGRAGLSAAEEATQEVAEGVATRHGTNEATGQDGDLFADSFGNAVLGALGGGVVGGVSGAMDRPERDRSPAPAAPVDEGLGIAPDPLQIEGPRNRLALPAPDRGAPALQIEAEARPLALPEPVRPTAADTPDVVVTPPPAPVDAPLGIRAPERPLMIEGPREPAPAEAAPGVIIPAAPERAVHPGFEKPYVGSGSAPMGSVAPPVSQQAGAAPIPAPSMGDPLGILPEPAPAAPVGPLTAAVSQLAPAPVVAAPPEPKFPDQKPGAAIRLAGTDGIVGDGVFMRETPEGAAVVRVDGQEHTLSPFDFDRARTEATRIDEEAKAAAKAGAKPTATPKPTAELPAPPVAPEGTNDAEQPGSLRPYADPAGRGAAASPAEGDFSQGLAGDNEGAESGAAAGGGGTAPAGPAAGSEPGDAQGLAGNADAGNLDGAVAPAPVAETAPVSGSVETDVSQPIIEPIRAKAAILRGVPKETPPDVPGVSLKWDDKAGGFIFSRKHTDKVQAAVGGNPQPLTVEPQEAPAARPKGWQKIGTNPKGFPVFEDENGVRSYVEKGIRLTESVGIIPGGGISVNKERRWNDYKTVEEVGAEQPEAPAQPEAPKAPPAPAKPKVDRAAWERQEARIRNSIPGMEGSGNPHVEGMARLGHFLVGLPQADKDKLSPFAPDFDLSTRMIAGPEPIAAIIRQEIGDDAADRAMAAYEGAPAPKAQPAQSNVRKTDGAPGILSALSQEKQDRAAELKARLAAKARGQASSGLDPEYITLGGELVALYIEAGTKRFGQMLRDFAETTGLSLREAQAPMRAAYNHVRDTMDLDGEDVSDMDDAAAVMAEVRAALKGEEAPAADNAKSEPEMPDNGERHVSGQIAAKTIKTDKAITARGREVPVDYALVELDDLIPSQRDDGRDNPDYPQELQPRDRSTNKSAEQVRKIAADLRPALLGESPQASNGAPIILPTGEVLSGNGRTLALRQAPAARMGEYRAFLKSQGYPEGDMRKPVLVRIVKGDMPMAEAATFAREANERDQADMSVPEQAMADAKGLTPAILDLYRGGDVDAVSNADFVKAFGAAVLSPNDAGKMRDNEGRMTQDAVRRINAALLAKAYGDAGIVSSVLESTDTNIKAIGGALTDVAPLWAQMRAEVERGNIAPDADRTADLVEAVKLVDRARRENRPLSDFLNQTDMFAGDSVSPGAVAFLGLLYRDTGPQPFRRALGRDKVADGLTFYATEALKTAPGVDLLGERADTAAILEAAKGRINDGQSQGQPSLFDGGANPGGSPAPAVGGRTEPAPEAGETGLRGQGGSSIDQGGVSPEEQHVRGQIAAAFAEHWAMGVQPRNIREARTLARDVLGREIGDKDIEEGIEAGLVRVARQIVEDGRRLGASPASIFDALVQLYNEQPLLTTRTSTSVEQQAYSTPAPLAFAASTLAGIDTRTSVYEPSAGNGMLLIGADPRNVTANELNDDRFAMLQEALPGAVLNHGDGTQYAPAAQVDRVIANPPFGKVMNDGKAARWPVDGVFTSEIDHAIAWKALQSLKPGGRAVLIIGGHQGTDAERAKAYMGRTRHPFFTKLYDQFNVTDHFTVDGKMYERQGAGWPVDVIVIEGKGKSALSYPYVSAPRLLSSWGSIREVIGSAKGNVDATSALSDNNRDPAGTANGSADQGAVSGLAGGSAEPGVRGGKRPGPRGSGSGGVRNGQAGPVTGAGSGSGGELDGAPEPDEPGRRDVPDQPGSNEGGGRAGSGSPDPAGNGGRALQPVKRPERTNTEEETGFQVQYAPHSAASFAVGTLVPRAMQSAADDALTALRDEVGDIDQFVADKLGYPVARITGGDGKPGYFSAEQVDALALAIKNIEDGAAFIIGDQTGVGKGRVVAGALLYAKRSGRVPVFVTKQPGLFADMVRDLRDIGEAGAEKTILSTKDLRGDFVIPLSSEPGDVLQTPPAPKLKALIQGITKSGNLPDGYEYFFTTYSQMQWEAGSGGAATYRQNALRSLAPNAVMILDESHEAGGTEQRNVDPETGEIIPTRADFFRDVLSSAHGVMFSSATYAKNPTVMTLYAKTDMRLAVEDMSKLPDAVKAGGVPLQQVIANMLVKSGQYMRRERSFAGVEMALTQLKTDRKLAASGAESIRGIFALDLEYMEDARSNFLDALAAAGLADGGDRSTGGSGAGSVGFASVMHNLVSQMLFALKSEAVADRAIELWRQGEKPLIAVSNTNESILSDFVGDAGIAMGDGANFTFKELFLRYLNRLRRVTVKDSNKNKKQIVMTDEQLLEYGGPDALAAFKAVEKAIAKAPIGKMPGSPLDYLMDRMRAAGMNVGEITGRGMVIENGILKGRKASDAEKKRTMNDFNGGRLDAVLLNQSGSTGFSLHATGQKGNDGKQRHMIVLQPDPNIDVFMQMLGRIHRTGQIKLPKYTIAISDLAIEKRVAANLMRKMASLNANTTANKDSAVSLSNVVDFMNRYGDEVVNGILLEDPELSARLGIAPSAKGNRDGIAAKVTGRLAILDPDEVSEIYDRIEREYTSMIEALDRMGMNTLEAKTLDLQAKTLSEMELTPGDPGATSPFATGAKLETVSVRRLGKPFTPEQLEQEVEEVLDGQTPNEYTRAAVQKLRDLVEPWKEKQIQGIEKAQAALAEASTVAKRKAAEKVLNGRRKGWEESSSRLNDVIGAVQLIGMNKPLILRLEDNGISVQLPARSLGFDMKALKDNPTAASAIRVRFAVADASREVLLPLSKLIGKESPFDVTNAHDSYVNSAFIMGVSDGREERSIITGNLLSGFSKFKKGQVIMFTREDGRVESGVMMPKNFDAKEELASMPVTFAKAEDAMSFLRQGDGQRMVQTDDGVASVKIDSRGMVVLEARKQGGKPYYLNQTVRKAVGEFVAGRTSKGIFTATTDSTSDAIRAMKAWQEQVGATLQTTSFKDEAREVTGEAIPGSDKELRAGGETITPAQARTINAAARTELAHVGLLDKIGLRVEAGRLVGATGTYSRGVISILRNGAEGWRHTLDHEIVHALRDPARWGGTHGLFTAQEWRALVRAARADAGIRARIEAAYGDLDAAGQAEEMVAELYADWAQGRREVDGGPLRQALETIRSFFRAMASALRGEGFVDAARIMERIASGEVGGRGPDGPGGGQPRGEDGRFVATGAPAAPRAPRTETAAFRRWFGQSKVVDEAGNPLVVYHGTNANIEAFDPARLGESTDAPSARMGFFFASNPVVASSYADMFSHYTDTKIGRLLNRLTGGFYERVNEAALRWEGKESARMDGGNVMPVYLSIQNPKSVDFRGKEYREQSYADIIAEAKRQGHDGVILRNTFDRGFNAEGDELTDVIVAFDPNQIKSVNNGGNWNPDDPRIMEQRDMTAIKAALTAKARKAGVPFGSQGWRKGSAFWSDLLTDGMSRSNTWNTLSLVPGRALFKELGRNLLAAQAYQTHKDEMDAQRGEWHSRAAATADEWMKLRRKDSAANDAFMDLLHEATIAQVDPTKAFQPRNVPANDPEAVMREAARGRSHAALKKRFDALPPEFRAMWGKVRSDYDAIGDAFEAAILKNIELAAEVAKRRARRDHARRLEEIEDEGLTGAERDAAISEADGTLDKIERTAHVNGRARLAQLRKVFEANRLSGPYVPLARFGNFFVTVRDEGGKVTSFSMFETAGAQRAFLEDAEKQAPGRVQHGVMSDKDALRSQVDPSFVADVEGILASTGASAEVMDAIWQKWLETLPDQSIRTSKIHRKGRKGYGRDALRAYGDHLFHGSHQLAKLEWGLRLEDDLDEATEEAKRQADPNRAQAIVNEMKKRHAFTMNPEGSPLVAAASGMAFTLQLAASPAAALVNISQTTLVGAPMLAARFQKASMGGVLKHLGQASRDFTRARGYLEDANVLHGDEKAAMVEAVRRGVIDKTQAHSLAELADHGVTHSPARDQVQRALGFFFHHAERFNREVTFLAAYRLAKAEGMSPADAIEAATDATWASHFDVQNNARPRFMQNDLGKLLTTFRSFQVNMLWRMFRDMHQTFNGASPELRREARLQLTGITLSMMAHAGIRGVWGYALLTSLLAIFLPGDDDDLDAWLQDALLFEGDSAPVTAWNFIMGAALNGVPGQITGTDLTNRIGMAELWFREPYDGLTGSEIGWHYVKDLLGPTVGWAFGSIPQGLGEIGEGEYWRGTERIIPKAVRDPMKAARYAWEGVQSKDGDIILDNVSVHQVITQALGFTPAQVAQRYEQAGILRKGQREIEQRRRKLHKEATDALRAGKGIPAATIERIRTFNREVPEWPVTSETIRSSYRGREAAAGRAQIGVNVNPRLTNRLTDTLPQPVPTL